MEIDDPNDFRLPLDGAVYFVFGSKKIELLPPDGAPVTLLQDHLSPYDTYPEEIYTFHSSCRIMYVFLDCKVLIRVELEFHPT